MQIGKSRRAVRQEGLRRPAADRRRMFMIGATGRLAIIGRLLSVIVPEAFSVRDLHEFRDGQRPVWRRRRWAGPVEWRPHLVQDR